VDARFKLPASPNLCVACGMCRVFQLTVKLLLLAGAKKIYAKGQIGCAGDGCAYSEPMNAVIPIFKACTAPAAVRALHAWLWPTTPYSTHESKPLGAHTLTERTQGPQSTVLPPLGVLPPIDREGQHAWLPYHRAPSTHLTSALPVDSHVHASDHLRHAALGGWPRAASRTAGIGGGAGWCC
jgi:hypothetical protein